MDGAALAKEPIRFTFVIDEFEQRYAEGYEPEMFRTVHAPYKILRIASNEILYAIDSQGNWKPVNTSPPEAPDAAAGATGAWDGTQVGGDPAPAGRSDRVLDGGCIPAPAKEESELSEPRIGEARMGFHRPESLGEES